MSTEKLEKVNIKEFERMFVWVGDSGATFHITKIEEEFLFLEPCKERVQFTKTGNKETKIKMGTWRERDYISKKNKMSENVVD